MTNYRFTAASLASLIMVGSMTLAAAPAQAQECLLDINDDNVAGPGDTDGAADSDGAFSLACGSFAVSTVQGTAVGSSSVAVVRGTAVGAASRARGEDSTAIGFDTLASGDRSTAVGSGSRAAGSQSTALGVESSATAINSSAIGTRSLASGLGSTALGAFSTALGDNSVALGNRSTANEELTVSVGNAIGTPLNPIFQRRLVNVAAGTGAFDAVNLSQLNSTSAATLASANAFTLTQITGLSFDLREVQTEARRGIASAMAMTNAPFPSNPGGVSYAANTAVYRGEVAGSISLSYRLNSDNPTALSAAASYGGGGEFGARVGIAGEF